MAKAAKAKPKSEADTTPPAHLEIPNADSDNVVTGAFDPADDHDPYYNRESSDNADVDHVPDSYYDDRPKDDNREEEDARPLVSPEQLKILHDGAERHQTPIVYMKIDGSGHFTTGEKNLEGSRFLALPDYVAVGRTLFIKDKPVEKHSHFWIEHGSSPPARPKDRFTDRTKWPGYNKTGYDPFGSTYLAIAFRQKSGGIVLFEPSKPEEKILIANLVKDFDGRRRPIVELTREEDPDDANVMRAGFKIIGYDTKGERFDFLRDVMVRNDPEFAEPVEKPFSIE